MEVPDLPETNSSFGLVGSLLPALACMSIANRSITIKVATLMINNGKASIYIIIIHNIHYSNSYATPSTKDLDLAGSPIHNVGYMKVP